MDFNSYHQLFEAILSKKITSEPYLDEAYLEYVKLNLSRMNRWLKSGKLTNELTELSSKINDNQKWILITEPWCGDAAHIVPFIKMIADTNAKISLEIQLRDEDSEIENYLTNTTKSIPKLIIRNSQNTDLFIWGPRPKNAQDFFFHLNESIVDPGERKLELQKWYNTDKGLSFQEEILEFIKSC